MFSNSGFQQAKESKRESERPNFRVLGFLIVLEILAAALFWLSLKRILGGSGGGEDYLISAAALILWLNFISLPAVFLAPRRYFVAASIFSASEFLLFFGFPGRQNGWVLGLALLVFLVYYFNGYNLLRRDIESRLRPHYRQTFGFGLSRFLTPVFLLITVVFYIYAAPGLRTNFSTFKIPRPLFNLIIKSVNNPSLSKIEKNIGKKKFFPNLSNSKGAEINFQPRPSNDSNNKAKLVFLRRYGDKIYVSLNEQIQLMLAPYSSQMAILAAVGLFLLLRSLAVFFRAALAILIEFVFLFMIKFQLLKKETRTKEQIIYKL